MMRINQATGDKTSRTGQWANYYTIEKDIPIYPAHVVASMGIAVAVVGNRCQCERNQTRLLLPNFDYDRAWGFVKHGVFFFIGSYPEISMARSAPCFKSNSPAETNEILQCLCSFYSLWYIVHGNYGVKVRIRPAEDGGFATTLRYAKKSRRRQPWR